MRPVLLWLSSIFIFLNCFGQQKTVDSLKVELKKYPQQDTNRLRVLNQLSQLYWSDKAETGIAMADEAILLAKKFTNNAELASAYHIKGLCYYTKGAFDTSLDFHKTALDIATRDKNPVLMVKALNRIGGNYISLSDYPQAISFLQRGLTVAEENHYRSGLAAITGNLATVHFLLSDYPKALENAFLAADIYQEQGQRIYVAVMYNNIGSMYLKAKNNEKAIEYNLKALKITDSFGNKKGIANDCLDIGTAYSELGNYSLALDYLSRARSLYAELGSKYNASLAFAALAAVYNLAPDSLLKKQGIDPKDRLRTALQYQHDALKLAIETKNMDNVSNQWESLSKIFESNHYYDSALYAYKHYAIIHDSIAGDKKKQEITRKQTMFEAEKKEAVVSAAHTMQLAQETKTRNIITASGVILLLGGLLSFVFYKRKNDAEAGQKEADLKTAIVNTEMKALRAQMNPHFIFNSLNSISDYIAKNNIKVADEYLTKFARLMRLVLENSEKKEVSLAEDLKALELYIQLETLRLNHQLAYEIKVDEGIDPLTTLIPPLILQPFVENSIWHGLARRPGTGNILIQIKKEGDMLHCVVEDNGVGRQHSSTVSGLQDNTGKRSLGMKITKDRIDMINSIKKTSAAVSITDLQQGTRVELRLPLETRF